MPLLLFGLARERFSYPASESLFKKGIGQRDDATADAVFGNE